MTRSDKVHPASESRPALTGCPWRDATEMLKAAGLYPIRQRLALGWFLFDKGARHLTAEIFTRKRRSPKSRSRFRPSTIRSINSLTPASCDKYRSAQRPFSTPTYRLIATFILRIVTS